MMFGICLILDGREMDTHTGFTTEGEARENAAHFNANPANRFDEDGCRIYQGEWVAYRISDGKTYR